MNNTRPHSSIRWDELRPRIDKMMTRIKEKHGSLNNMIKALVERELNKMERK